MEIICPACKGPMTIEESCPKGALCPHCSQPISVEEQESGKPFPLHLILIPCLALLIIAGVAWAGKNVSADSLKNFGATAGGIGIVFGVGCLLYLAVLWFVFPWMVLRKMNQLIRAVKEKR